MNHLYFLQSGSTKGEDCKWKHKAYKSNLTKSQQLSQLHKSFYWSLLDDVPTAYNYVITRLTFQCLSFNHHRCQNPHQTVYSSVEISHNIGRKCPKENRTEFDVSHCDVYTLHLLCQNFGTGTPQTHFAHAFEVNSIQYISLYSPLFRFMIKI